MANAHVSDRDIVAQIPAAFARAKAAMRSEPHATCARYSRRLRTLHVTLTNGGAFEVPVSLIPGLRHASDAALAEVEVVPGGLALHWERLDADMSVVGLARLVLGTKALLRAAGAAAGAARTRAKAVAARQNGLKGDGPVVDPDDGRCRRKAEAQFGGYRADQSASSR